MTCCRAFFSLFFCLFAPLFPSPPALCRYLLPLVRVVFVRETTVIFFVFCLCNNSDLRVDLSAQQVSVPLQHVRCFSCSLSFPIFLHHILQKTCRLFCFVSFVPFFSSIFFFFLSLFLSWSGLFGSVLVPGTLAFHMLYVDELRLFGLLCFTV